MIFDERTSYNTSRTVQNNTDNAAGEHLRGRQMKAPTSVFLLPSWLSCWVQCPVYITYKLIFIFASFQSVLEGFYFTNEKRVRAGKRIYSKVRDIYRKRSSRARLPFESQCCNIFLTPFKSTKTVRANIFTSPPRALDKHLYSRLYSTTAS